MRVAVISDTHFGDPHCTLVTANGGDTPHVGPAYEAFKSAVGKVDYLVLLGDIIDFSVASYDTAYKHARAFFKKLHEDGLVREIVYVPGNHDFDVWHTVEHQVNVINRLEQGQLPRAFKRTVPGVFDDRRETDKFLLPDVARKRDVHDPEPHYGNLYFDDITREAREGRIEGEPLTFNFAYPNIYLVTETGESIMLTHGHYFEAFWSAAAEWASYLASDDLELERGEELNLREMVGLNLPLNQLACTGIGQAQPLAQLAQRVQVEVNGGRSDLVLKYIDRIDQRVREERGLSWPKRVAARLAVRWAKKRFLNVLETLDQTRYQRNFLARPNVRNRFRQYYRYSLHEIERLQEEFALDIPPPSHVVFGHTHRPIPWGAEEFFDVVDGHSVGFCNTGGWILREDRESLEFVGAEVLLYESGKGLSSVSVRTSDVYPMDIPHPTNPAPQLSQS